MRLSRSFSLFVPALAACLFLSRPATAFERQWHVGGGIGAALFPSHYNLGPVAGIHAAYGISDMFDAKLELLGSMHELASEPLPGLDTSQAQIYSAALGLAYKLDVLQWVPYGALLVGYYRTEGAVPATQPLAQDDIGLSLAFGLDYAATRQVGLGFQARTHTLFSNPSEGQYATFLLRAEYRWGW